LPFQNCCTWFQERRRAGIQPGDRSLLAFMLRHQQQQQQEDGDSSTGAVQVTDKDIRDQLMTFMFAGGWVGCAWRNNATLMDLVLP
jgi:cytochrome P450